MAGATLSPVGDAQGTTPMPSFGASAPAAPRRFPRTRRTPAARRTSRRGTPGAHSRSRGPTSPAGVRSPSLPPPGRWDRSSPGVAHPGRAARRPVPARLPCRRAARAGPCGPHGAPGRDERMVVEEEDPEVAEPLVARGRRRHVVRTPTARYRSRTPRPERRTAPALRGGPQMPGLSALLMLTQEIRSNRVWASEGGSYAWRAEPCGRTLQDFTGLEPRQACSRVRLPPGPQHGTTGLPNGTRTAPRVIRALLPEPGKPPATALGPPSPGPRTPGGSRPAPRRPPARGLAERSPVGGGAAAKGSTALRSPPCRTPPPEERAVWPLRSSTRARAAAAVAARPPSWTRPP